MNPREAIERFHLVFLRHFAAAVSPGTVCLKGGVNLRLFLNSPRVSEDIDFDARVVGVEILKKNVNKVLTSRPLISELAAAGISLSEIKPAKQTQTVQRWKFHVVLDANPLPTRLEFSRRNDEPFENCVTEPPSLALLADHKVPLFVFNHYAAEAAYRQKVNALATRTQVQARDVFDLHHLSGYGAPRDLPPQLVIQAIEQLALVSFDMYWDQVIPFLPVDLAMHYGTPAAWNAMFAKVRNDLSAAAVRPGTP